MSVKSVPDAALPVVVSGRWSPARRAHLSWVVGSTGNTRFFAAR